MRLQHSSYLKQRNSGGSTYEQKTACTTSTGASVKASKAKSCKMPFGNANMWVLWSRNAGTGFTAQGQCNRNWGVRANPLTPWAGKTQPGGQSASPVQAAPPRHQRAGQQWEMGL